MIYDTAECIHDCLTWVNVVLMSIIHRPPKPIEDNKNIKKVGPQKNWFTLSRMVTHGQALLMLCHSADAHFTVLTSSKAWGEVDKHEQVKSRKFRSFCHTEPRFVLKMIIYFIANFRRFWLT